MYRCIYIYRYMYKYIYIHINKNTPFCIFNIAFVKYYVLACCYIHCSSLFNTMIVLLLIIFIGSMDHLQKQQHHRDMGFSVFLPVIQFTDQS